MNFLQRIFGYRSTLAPSGSLPRAELRKIAQEFTFNAGVVHAWDLVIYEVSNTNSMLPCYDQNALLLAEACPFDALREGDVVTYWAKNNGHVVHKLNNRQGDGWWPVGTGNASADPELVTRANFDRRICGVFYGAKDATTDR